MLYNYANISINYSMINTCTMKILCNNEPIFLITIKILDSFIICMKVYKICFREKKSLNCTLCSATGRTIVYHLGSAALGSFLITLIKIPRYILMKISAKYVHVLLV